MQPSNPNSRSNHLSMFLITTLQGEVAHVRVTAMTSVFALALHQPGFPRPRWQGGKHVGSIIIQCYLLSFFGGIFLKLCIKKKINKKMVLSQGAGPNPAVMVVFLSCRSLALPFTMKAVHGRQTKKK